MYNKLLLKGVVSFEEELKDSLCKHKRLAHATQTLVLLCPIMQNQSKYNFAMIEDAQLILTDIILYLISTGIWYLHLSYPPTRKIVFKH